MLGKAIAITAQAFEGRKDKGQQPYIMHCLRVMNAVSHLGEEAMQAAVMHDLLEDCPDKWDGVRLRRTGFSARVVETVELLTHDKEVVSYDRYIKNISNDPLATAIKMADLRDNSDITRMKGLRKKDLERLEKYHRAYMYLKD